MQREHGAWGMCRGKAEGTSLLGIRKTATTGGRRTHKRHGLLACEASNVNFRTSRGEQGVCRTWRGGWAEEGRRNQITKDESGTADAPRRPYFARGITGSLQTANAFWRKVGRRVDARDQIELEERMRTHAPRIPTFGAGWRMRQTCGAELRTENDRQDDRRRGREEYVQWEGGEEERRKRGGRQHAEDQIQMRREEAGGTTDVKSTHGGG